MNDKQCFRTDASDSCMYQHLYLRGNFQMDMFYDKVDMINVWNRLWLSAAATGARILSAEILNNHLHLAGIFQSEEQRTNFKHHFRLSVTQYHNRRYGVNGTLGTRRFKHAALKDDEDIKDCICYHIRNVLHHGITSDYLGYTYSTARFAFGLASADQQGYYSRETLPENLSQAYLPTRERLPKGWMTTREGMIVPPESVFCKEIVEELFYNSRETYLEALSHRTRREAGDTSNDDGFGTDASDSCAYQTLDEQVVEFVKENCRIPIPAMNESQKMIAIYQVLDNFPKANMRLLSRLFGIPPSTLCYRMKISHTRE